MGKSQKWFEYNYVWWKNKNVCGNGWQRKVLGVKNEKTLKRRRDISEMRLPFFPHQTLLPMFLNILNKVSFFEI